jgi:hypothetical protein
MSMKHVGTFGPQHLGFQVRAYPTSPSANADISFRINELITSSGNLWLQLRSMMEASHVAPRVGHPF